MRAYYLVGDVCLFLLVLPHGCTKCYTHTLGVGKTRGGLILNIEVIATIRKFVGEKCRRKIDLGMMGRVGRGRREDTKMANHPRPLRHQTKNVFNGPLVTLGNVAATTLAAKERRNRWLAKEDMHQEAFVFYFRVF